MTKKASIPEEPPRPFDDDECFRFPTLSDARAQEIAHELAILTGYDEDVFSLVTELALGLAPAKPDDRRDNLTRFDVAYAFAAELFRLTPGFDSCARAHMHEVFKSAQGGVSQ